MDNSKVLEKAVKKNKWQIVESAAGGFGVNGDRISGVVLVESLSKDKIYLVVDGFDILSGKDNVVRLKAEVFDVLEYYTDKEEGIKNFNAFRDIINEELALVYPDTSKMTLNEKIEWQREHSGSRFAEQIEGDIQAQFNILKTDDELYFFTDEGGESEAEQKDYWEKNLSKYKPISERNKENYKGLKKYFEKEPSEYGFYEGYNPPWIKRIMSELASERRQLEKVLESEEKLKKNDKAISHELIDLISSLPSSSQTKQKEASKETIKEKVRQLD